MDDRTVTGRVMAVLDAVAAFDDAATLAAMTRRTAIPKATVRRIAADLVARGLLEREGACHRLGPRLAELGAYAAQRQPLSEAAIPHVQDLFLRTREIAFVGAFTKTTSALLHTAFGSNRAADMRRPWPTALRSTSFLATATGRVLLADRPDLAENLRSRALPRLTPYTTTDWTRVAAAIDAARDDGVCVEHEQSMLGYNCVAARVRGPDGRTIGVVGVIGRAGSFSASRMAGPVRAAAADVEQVLHWEARVRPLV